jgi:hypothetical protein
MPVGVKLGANHRIRQTAAISAVMSRWATSEQAAVRESDEACILCGRLTLHQSHRRCAQRNQSQGTEPPIPIPVPIPDLPGIGARAGDGGPTPDFAGDRGPIPIPDLPESGIKLSTIEYCKGVDCPGSGPRAFFLYSQPSLEYGRLPWLALSVIE